MEARGFTLLELLIVVAIMAVATAGVSFAMRDSSQTQLEREGQRLAALLETARARSRITGIPVRWRVVADGFVFDGLTGETNLPTQWLGTDTQASGGPVTLGPEPLLTPQYVRLAMGTQPGRSLVVGSNGLQPFRILAGDAPAAESP